MENEKLLELIHDLFENLSETEKQGFLDKSDYKEFLERHSKEDQEKIRELMKLLLNLNHIDELRDFFKVNYGYHSYQKFSRGIL